MELKQIREDIGESITFDSDDNYAVKVKISHLIDCLIERKNQGAEYVEIEPSVDCDGDTDDITFKAYLMRTETEGEARERVLYKIEKEKLASEKLFAEEKKEYERLKKKFEEE